MMQLQQLDEVFLNYLKEDNVDYAILLNGDWGSGKTFYIKNHLIQVIQDSKLEIKPIYVSLFGIKSSSDLGKKLMIQMFPFLDTKFGKAAGALSKVALSTFGINLGEASAQEVVAATGKLDKGTIILFDDLERLDPNSLEEVIGYINQFVEHDNVKVIIAANIKEIGKGHGGTFTKYIEKLVRYTIEFVAPFDEVGKRIMKLSKHGELFGGIVLNAFRQGNCTNLRTLQFIASMSSELINNIPNDNTVKKYRQEIIENVFHFVTVIAIESKQHSLTIEEARKMVSLNTTTPLNNLFNEFANLPSESVEIKEIGKNKKKLLRKVTEVVDRIRDSYYDSTRMVYFDSIVDFVYTGFHNKENFKDEVILLAEYLEKEQGTDEGKALSKLQNFHLVEDDQITDLINEVLKYARDGKYPLGTYRQVFQLVRRLIRSGVFKMKEKKLLKQLSEGILKCSIDNFDSDFFDVPDQNDVHLTKLRQRILRKHHDSQLTKEREEAEDHLRRMFTDPSKYNSEIAGSRELLPTLCKSIKARDFLSKFLSLTNNDKYQLCIVMNSRTLNTVSFTRMEIQWMKDLTVRIEKKIKNKKASVSKINLESLRSVCSKIIKQVSQIEADLPQD